MAWVKIEDGVVVQKQPNAQEGFIEAPDDVVCGMVQTEDGFEVPVKVETPEQIIARLESAIDNHLDAVANSYRYESIRTMVTYATSEHPTFGAEGKAAVLFRDACYQKGIDILADVQNELRPVPTEAELIAEMPSFESFLE
jgi:hypothetical protein